MRSKSPEFFVIVNLLFLCNILRSETSPDQRIADSLTDLSASLQARGLYSLAETNLRRALVIRQAGFDSDTIEVALALSNLGAVEQEMGNTEEAQRLQSVALTTAKRLLAPNDAALVPYLTNKAELEQAVKHYQIAEALLDDALKITQAAQATRQEAHVWVYLGELYATENRFDKAEAAYNRALGGYQAAAPSDRLQVVRILNDLGALASSRSYYSAGLAFAARAGDLCAAISTESLVCGLAWNSLASIEISMGKNVSAERHAQRALAQLSEVAGPKDRLTAAAMNNLGQAYSAQGRSKEAEQTLAHAAGIFQNAGGANDTGYASSIANIGALYVNEHKNKKAEPFYRRAADIDREALGEGSAKYGQDLNRLGVLLVAENHKTEAEAYLRKALGIETKALGEASPALAEPYINLGVLLQSEKRREESLDCYQRGLKLMEAGSGRSAPQMAGILEGYSGLLKEMQLWAEAEKASTEAIGLRVQKTIHPDSFQ